LFEAAKLSPAIAPEYLLPKSYFDTILANDHAWFVGATLHNPDPAFSVFRATKIAISNSRPETPPWEDAFLTSVIGWGIKMGFRNPLLAI
jgi:hypothetical protein